MARSFWQGLVKGTTATVVFFALAEVIVRGAYLGRERFVEAVPLPYVLGDRYGVLPPWHDRRRILEPDPELVWRNRPGFRESYVGLFVPFASDEARLRLARAFAPGLPDELHDAGRWDVTIDSRGFREEEFRDEKAPGVFRILCLGDSWTFGANVPQDRAYPRQLAALLHERFPGARFEVLNLGVLGYSSFQGRELLERRAIHWQPDLVVLGFGMNDGRVPGYRDKDLPGARASLTGRAARALEWSEFYKLLRYAAERVRARDQTTAKGFREAVEAERRGSAVDWSALEPWTRVSLPDYRENVHAMIGVARTHGAGAILLENEMVAGPYGAALADVAAAESVPLVKAPELLAEARRRIEGALESRFDLAPVVPAAAAAGPDVEVVFRVLAGGAAAGGIHVVGDDPALGDSVPNRVALRDDGGGGDQRAFDGVWSLTVPLPRGARIHYVYTRGGAEGAWQGLDVPALRRLVVPTDGPARLVRPIETFGSIFLESDAWHTDATGLGLVAAAVLHVLEEDERVLSYVASVPGTARLSSDTVPR